MQVIDKNNDGLKREFNVVVAAATIADKVQSRLSEVGQQVRLPGFRPGKVPMNLLRKRFGQAVWGEVLERTIDESTQAALTQKSAKPAMQPKVEVVKAEEGQDLEFSVQFEVTARPSRAALSTTPPSNSARAPISPASRISSSAPRPATLSRSK
jgi:trigger factor